MDNEMQYYENLQLGKKTDYTLPFHYSVSKSPSHIKYTPRWHEEIEIKYIISGSAEIVCGTDVFLASEGDVVIINSCELHATQTNGDESVAYHLLMVSPDIPLLHEATQTTMPHFKHLIRGDRVLAGHLELLFRELNEKPTAYQLGAFGALALIFSHLQRHHAVSDPSTTPENRRMADRIQPALDHIVRHYPEEISIDTLAHLCTMSVYHFCRIFKTVTGNTAIGYINQLRISKASALLRGSNLPVAEVASLVGYSDVSYFSRCFKKQMGLSPAAYQKAEK